MTSCRTKIVRAANIAVAVALFASVATTVCLNTDQSASATASMESEITVVVDAVRIAINRINDTQLSGDEASGKAVQTYTAKNEISFTTDRDAYVRIMLGDKVLWEGDAKADQPTTVVIDMTGTPIGAYQLSIRASKMGDSLNQYAVAYFWLDYRATIPSIIGAPSAGAYVTVGGRVYSMTTIAFILLLIGVLVYLVATKYSKQELKKAPAKVKPSRR